jgi:hypothetical protein
LIGCARARRSYQDWQHDVVDPSCVGADGLASHPAPGPGRRPGGWPVSAGEPGRWSRAPSLPRWCLSQPCAWVCGGAVPPGPTAQRSGSPGHQLQLPADWLLCAAQGARSQGLRQHRIQMLGQPDSPGPFGIHVQCGFAEAVLLPQRAKSQRSLSLAGRRQRPCRLPGRIGSHTP